MVVKDRHFFYDFFCHCLCQGFSGHDLISYCLGLHVLLRFLLSYSNHAHGILDLLQFIITALLFSQVGILIQLPRYKPLIQFPLEMPHRLKFLLQLYLLLRL